MPRRSLLTPSERDGLLAFPDTEDDFIRYYTFSVHDRSAIRQRRGDHNRLGFAVQLCYLRYPGYSLPTDAEPSKAFLSFICNQLGIETHNWFEYANRPQTRREHLAELQAWVNLTLFSLIDHQRFVPLLAELAKQTDRGIVLAEAMVEMLRQRHIILPTIDVIERVCSESLTLGTRQVYKALVAPLSEHHCRALDGLLNLRESSKGSELTWLRQSPGPPKPKHILIHLERLNAILKLGLPDGLEREVHQNRLMKLSREGGQMTAQHLRDLEPTRRHATLLAVILDTRATLIDETIDLHNRFMGALFSKAKRNHADRFQQSGKNINDKVRLYSRIGRALLNSKESGEDPFAAIEAIIPWTVFCDSITEAEKLAQPGDFDYLSLVSDSFSQLRRYIPILLDTLVLNAAPVARELLAGVKILKEMSERLARKVPANAPTSFVPKR